MKHSSAVIIAFMALTFSTSASRINEEAVQLVCMRKQSAANLCHYNFVVNGVNYRYIDPGCKSKKEDVIKKAKDGRLGLAKEWKVECPVSKSN